jgi:hypothetical protein
MMYVTDYEGWRLLDALGVDLTGVFKAVMTFEVDTVVTVVVERHGAWDPSSEMYQTITETYELVKKVEE